MPRTFSSEAQFVAACFDTAISGGCAWDMDCARHRLAEGDIAAARRALANARLSLRAAELFLRELCLVLERDQLTARQLRRAKRFVREMRLLTPDLPSPISHLRK